MFHFVVKERSRVDTAVLHFSGKVLYQKSDKKMLLKNQLLCFIFTKTIYNKDKPVSRFDLGVLVYVSLESINYN